MQLRRVCDRLQFDVARRVQAAAARPNYFLLRVLCIEYRNTALQASATCVTVVHRRGIKSTKSYCINPVDCH